MYKKQFLYNSKKKHAVKKKIEASFFILLYGDISSVVEHSTADREVPGSNPGVPFLYNSNKKHAVKKTIQASFFILLYGDIAQW